ncbi:MAG: methylenetetrahydrofolate reductase, partial [Muribaculaceae bacterium]
DGHAHASELQAQVNAFNKGFFIDGTSMDIVNDLPFSYGVAGYPEKHEESPNMEMDLMWLKAKVDAGADYIVTQMFFDNAKYYDFVERARKAGINVPIIPGLKPIINSNQITLLPKAFKVDLPMELTAELIKCKNDDEIKALGVEWCAAQSEDLLQHGVKSIHYYSHNAVKSVHSVVSKKF